MIPPTFTVSCTNTLFYIHTDHLGSYNYITDASKNRIDSLHFDPWGNRMKYHKWTQPDTGRTFFSDRGFTGHEHLDQFKIINMNGRLYDPVIARFFSPDPFVQMPDFTQNYNRYSYCLNNPLMYTDPDGEWVHLVIGAVVGGMMNWMTNGAEISWKGLAQFGIGAAAGLLGAGVGAGISSAVVGGSFGAGFVGSSAALTSTGFAAGMASGMGAGLSSGFVLGAGNSWMGGNNFGQGLLDGFKGGVIGGVTGGIAGGVFGGIDALTKGVDFWTGEGTFDLSQGYAASGAKIPEGTKTVTGRYVGQIEGVNVYESKMLGEFNPRGGYSGVTIPERGIIVGKGVFRGDWDMMKHEFGHILQYRIHGSAAYWNVIAPESLHSATFNPRTHSNFWTETYANYLGSNYFGSWNYSKYPIQNISYENHIRLLRFKYGIPWW